MRETQKQREVVELQKVYHDHPLGRLSTDATMNLESMSEYESGFPKIEEFNEAIAAHYEDHRRDGIKQDDEVKRVGELHGVGRTRILQIVEMRRLERGEVKRGRGRPRKVG